MKTHPQSKYTPSRTCSARSVFALSSACLLVGGTALSAANGTWTSTSSGDGIGNWTEAGNNWGMGVGVYPGSADTNDFANITGGEVTLDTNLPFALGKIDMSGTSVLNLSADLQTNAGTFQLFNGPSVTVNQTAGTWSRTANAQNIFLGTSGATASTDTNTWNISGTGSLDLSSSNFTSFGLGYSPNNSNHLGTSTLNISEQGSFRIGRSFRMVKENSHLNIDASEGATFRQGGGSLTNDGVFMTNNSNTPTVAYHSTISVTGYHEDTVLDVNSNFNAFHLAEGLGNTATVEFILSDNPNGVNAWDVNVLNLGDTGAGNVKGDLEVDVSLLSGANAITLFSYIELLNGEFGDVSIVYSGLGELALDETFTGTDASTLDNGNYFLDYGSGSNDSIILYYNAVPEPSAFALAAGGVVALMVFRRRRHM